MQAMLMIVAFAGTGEKGYTGDGGPATKAKLDNPFAVAVTRQGDVFFSDTNNHVVRKVAKVTGIITTVAGTGKKGYTGDKGPATQATLNEPYGIALDSDENLFIVDRLNYCIRRVDAKSRTITTVAGTGKSGTTSREGEALKTAFEEPNGICEQSGMLYIADVKASKILAVNLEKGTFGTLIGKTATTATPDGTPLAEGKTYSTTTKGPRALCTGPDSTIYFVEREGNCVRKIDVGFNVTRVAGTGKKGYTGDGGKALDATFDGPKEIAVDKDGNIYVCDTENEAIRRIDAKTQIITTVAGKGRTKTPGLGDGDDPLKATLGRPHGVAVDREGNLYIGDTLSHRIRVVKPRP